MTSGRGERRRLAGPGGSALRKVQTGRVLNYGLGNATSMILSLVADGVIR